jgi:hypothetical protein
MMKKRPLLALAGIVALAASVAAAQQDRPADEAEAAPQDEAEVVEVAVEPEEKRSDEDAIVHSRDAFFARMEAMRERAEAAEPLAPAPAPPGHYRHTW